MCLSVVRLIAYLRKKVIYQIVTNNGIKKISEDATGQVQPDWNQNDNTAADYIKNRPFYTGDPVETVVVEESTISFSDSDELYIAQFQSTFSATVGESYNVSWDGTVYECKCADFNGNLVIGNLSILGVGSDTGEPFIMIVDNGSAIDICTKDTSASHTISISVFAVEVVKIDPKYLYMPFKPIGKSYLTFSSLSSFTLNATKRWNGILEYFASDGTWTTWDGISTLSAVYDDGEYVLYLRGTGNAIITRGAKWTLTGSDIACIGNIENLLDYTTVESGKHPPMVDGCYQNMFYNCTSLTQAPSLPATTLTTHCYYGMFYGCTGLTKAPSLPATTLVDNCYQGMFYGCTSLIQAPALPATTLTTRCYQGMFYNCTSLKLSSTKTDEYAQEYRIPSSGNGTTETTALTNMFYSTGGTFTGTPEINTTYYLSSDNMIVRENELATLNGHIGSLIDAAIEDYANTAEYIIPSSTSGSTKKFKITVDDSGTISATEVI